MASRGRTGFAYNGCISSYIPCCGLAVAQRQQDTHFKRRRANFSLTDLLCGLLVKPFASLVARTASSTCPFSFLKTTKTTSYVRVVSTGPAQVGWHHVCSYPVQQPSPGAAAHVGFEDLSHSRRRANEDGTGRVILHQASWMGILVPILLPPMFHENDKMRHRHKMGLPSFG